MSVLTRAQIIDALELHLRTAADVLAVVAQFYPEHRLPVRSRLLIEEMFP